MPTPAISVVLPAFNAAEDLPGSVPSILAQTDPDFELIVVDDGSTDGTAAVARGFADGDDRVRVVRIPHGGIVPALNAGLDAARAPLVARMDADDWSHPERHRLQRAFLGANPGVGLVGSRVGFGGDREAHAGYAGYVDWINAVRTPADICLNRFVESPFAHPSVMFRRELVGVHGGYRDGEFPEDYELWLRWLDRGVEMAKVDEELVVWNDPPSRLSRTDSRYSFRAFYRCKAEYLARWLERHNPLHPGVVVWGAGRETRKRAEFLTDHGVAITAYVDIDPRKIGNTITGRLVLGEEQLPGAGNCFVLSYVGSRGARDDIRERLSRRGYVEGVDFLAAA